MSQADLQIKIPSKLKSSTPKLCAHCHHFVRNCCHRKPPIRDNYFGKCWPPVIGTDTCGDFETTKMYEHRLKEAGYE